MVMAMKMKSNPEFSFSLATVLVSLVLIQGAVAQSSEDLKVWNVYCSGDGSRCTVAKETAGDLMFPVFPDKVDWDTAQNWMQTNGYPAQPAEWNVYCNGDSSQCAVSKQAAGELMFPQFTGKVTWDEAQDWMASWRENNQPEVWNVYCSGDGSQCAIAKEATGVLMFPQFSSKVDWETAQEWMASWQGEGDANATGQSMAIGSGTSHTYNGIQFQVEGATAMVNPQQTTSSIDLQGMSGKAVHILEFAGWSTGLSDGVRVGQINVWYQDGGVESADLIMGSNIAEWAYDRQEIQSDLMHSKVAPAYSWSTSASSSYEYEGHYFYVKVDTDPERPLDRLELVRESLEGNVQIEIRAVTVEE